MKFKKLAALTLAGAMSLSLAACGGGGGVTPPPPPPTPCTETATTQSYPPMSTRLPSPTLCRSNLLD